MTFEFVPLLQIQRDLYDLPRGTERFQAYLKTMTDPKTGDLALPLVPMNPMGKEHVPALLDEYIRLDADTLAARAVSQVAGARSQSRKAFKVCLVIADDLKGGWTNRYASEFSYRFTTTAFHKRGWLVGILWTSEPPSAETARDEALVAVYRGIYIEEHGSSRTLREMLAQEGFAMAMARCRVPTLDDDDLVFTREVISPFLDASDQPTVMACVFGDEAARALGYRPQGLTERAGLALALYDARLAMPNAV
jgi:hypothetical protein